MTRVRVGPCALRGACFGTLADGNFQVDRLLFPEHPELRVTAGRQRRDLRQQSCHVVRRFAVDLLHLQRVDGGHVLASVSFTSRFISGRCRRVPNPNRYDSGGFGVGIVTRASFRCLTSKPIRVHVSATTNGSGRVIGGGLVVGIGSDTSLRVIASATLSRKGGRYSSRVYRSATYCKLGARAH